jgi:hypothetical protein
VTSDYTCLSLVILQNTSDGPLDLPVASVTITNNRLNYITITRTHYIAGVGRITQRDGEENGPLKFVLVFLFPPNETRKKKYVVPHITTWEKLLFLKYVGKTASCINNGV